MRLTTFSDYALRVLIYLGMRGEGWATVGEIAEAYGISRNHLTKVAHFLSTNGYVETARGKAGGMRLAMPPERIRLGELVRLTEEGTSLVECFDADTSQCRIQNACALKGAFAYAVNAFHAALDEYTLADMLRPQARLRPMLMPRQ